MKGFVDLSIRPKSVDDLERILEAAPLFGVEGFGVECTTLEGGPAGGGCPDALQAASRQGLKLYPRFTVPASTRREARRGIEAAPRDSLVVVEARSLDALRYAGVNKRVDVIRPAPGLEARAADSSQARLFEERGWGAIEYPVSRLLGKSVTAWRRFIAMTRMAFSHGIPLVLVSDARDPLGLWHPASLHGLLAAAGLPEDRAWALLVNSPLRVLRRRGLA